MKESSESCSAWQAYKAFAFRNGVLMGDESLDVDEVGIGLDGAENMGHDGERGEVGLGFGGSELGRLGLTTSRFESLEFRLGCRLLLELRMLFALEETDSKLELMMLFLCSCFSVDGTAWKSVRGLSLQDGGLESLLFFRDRCSWALVRGTSGTVLNIFSWFSIKISMTMF